MKITLIVLFFLNSYLLYGKSIAISFDDAPRGQTAHLKASDRTYRLLQGLKKSDVDQVIFFASTHNLNKPNRRKRLENYANAGHLIANHSHSHKSPEDLGLKPYLADIKKAHNQLKSYPNFTNYYRAPFLNYGKTYSLYNQIKNELKKLNYKIGYVTVDNGDWYMDSLLQKATENNQKINIGNLKKAYVEMIWDSIEFYDDLAVKVIGRSPAHILLLHENDLAALCIEDLISHIRSKGWNIISPTEAYSDPLAQISPKTLKNGDGKIAAIAQANSYNEPIRDRYQNKDQIDKKFKELNVFE